MDALQDNLKPSYSFCHPESHSSHSEPSWRSDVNRSASSNPVNRHCRSGQELSGTRGLDRSDTGLYYKKYEHDEIPVKDVAHLNRSDDINTDGSYGSLTNTELEKLEKNIYKNISQELQTDNSSVMSMESNIKFFKTTVQEIFDTFYISMRDFELYKKRFEDIITKNRIDSLADMEDFIKDMIHNIVSAESSNDHVSRIGTEIDNLEIKDNEHPSNTSLITKKQTEKLLGSLHSVIDAYKSENYLTDSTLEDQKSKLNHFTRKEETWNIYLSGQCPFVQIKMNDRHLLSEINIKEQGFRKESNVASAENLQKLAAKKQELAKYEGQQKESSTPDRNIPVKVSNAKKNIHLNEDFSYGKAIEARDYNKGLIAKICSYICKKIRKA